MQHYDDIRDYPYVDCRLGHDWDKHAAPIKKQRPGNMLEWRCTGPCRGIKLQVRSRLTGELVGNPEYQLPDDYPFSGHTRNDFYKEHMRRENGGKWGRK